MIYIRIHKIVVVSFFSCMLKVNSVINVCPAFLDSLNQIQKVAPNAIAQVLEICAKVATS